MNEFMKILLSLSLSGTLLLLLILGFKPLYKNKFSRRWQYYIWLIAALRFLLPFTPDTTIVGSLFESFGTAPITSQTSTAPHMPASASDFENTENMETEPLLPSKDKTGTVIGKPFHIYACLFFIWFTLALILFVRKVTIYRSFIKYGRAGNNEISDINILNLLSDCKEKLHIKASVELCQNSGITSPMMAGFFHPCIILPASEINDKELSYIFMHELTHYKQKDMLYKWLIQLVVCIHWFNPFVYLLEKEVNKACELSCDEKVISILDGKARREYGDTLISFMKLSNAQKNSCPSLTLTEGGEQLKERLGAIMNFKKKSKIIAAVTALFSVGACICFFIIGAYAAPPAENKKSTWKDGEIQNDILKEDGVYYIFCDGAGEDDKPLSSVSAGSVKFVLVRKGSYTSIGPFNNMETLMEDVAKQCESMKSLTDKEMELVIKTAAGIGGTSAPSPSYAKLMTYKTENYLEQSVADFNNALASTPDELADLLAAQAHVISTITSYDENYDFFTTTLNFSTDELYCQHMDEEVAFCTGISKMSRPLKELNEGEIMYEFNCFVDFNVVYSVNAPELVSVAQRDYTLLAFREEMQNYLDSLSEAEIMAGAADGKLKTALTDKGDKLADSLSSEHMTLSCEITLIEAMDAGDIYTIE